MDDQTAPNVTPETPEAFSPTNSAPPAAPTPPFTPSVVSADVSPPSEVSSPTPPQASPEPDSYPASLMPQPVVRVLSPRGVEYVFMTIALFTAAVGLGSALLSLVNGKTDFEVLSFPAALLLVGTPVFAWLFLRLKNAELQNPSLRLDASKRRSTQFIQIATFVVGFFTLVGFITAMFAKMAGAYDGSFIKLVLDILVIEVIAAGILAYYWRDEHRSV